VYTPPRFRQRRFGRVAVAAVAQHLIERGAREIYLFTDAGNSTSNGLYTRIGFEPIGTHLHLLVAREAH
jgi:predicted GNAT family acetyltransferase